MKIPSPHLRPLALVVLGLSLVWSCKKDEAEPAKTAPTGITTTAISNITQTTATAGGSVGASGGSDVLVRGVCYDTTASPTFDKNLYATSGSGTGAFTLNLTDLLSGKKYYVRAYAINSVGASYGPEVNFTTLAIINAPTVTTGAATNILVSGATCGGSISNNGGSGQTITEKGIQYSTTASILESDAKIAGIGPESGFTATITGLNSSSEYFYRAYAKNSDGKTGYGSVMSFTTAGNPTATVSTGMVTGVGLVKNAALYEATVTANLTNLNGGVFVKKGFVWSSTNSNPTMASKEGIKENAVSIPSGTFYLTISDAPRLKTVYVRAFVTTSFGGNEVTGYGNVVSFNTFIEDVENNKYNIVKTGGKIWMKESLKTKKFRSGSTINGYPTSANWLGAAAGSLPGWCYLEGGDPASANWGGLMYNGYAIKDPEGLCPVGYHVPTKGDWDALVAEYFGENSAGEFLKSNSSLWSSGSGTDVSGFSGMPSGIRLYNTGTHSGTGGRGIFWTTEIVDNSTFNARVMRSDDNTLKGYWANLGSGLPVRCVND